MVKSHRGKIFVSFGASDISPPRKSRQKMRFSSTLKAGFSASRWPR